jgi:hypothetical protein
MSYRIWADQRYPVVGFGDFMGHAMLAPFSVLIMEFQYFRFDLRGYPSHAFRYPILFTGFQTHIPIFFETRLLEVKSHPPYMRLLARCCDIAALLPALKEQFPLLRCRQWIVHICWSHPYIVLYYSPFS